MVPLLLLVACTSEAGSPTSSEGGVVDADMPAATSPVEASGSPTTVAGTQPVGFDATRAVVTGADGETCEICVWLAESADQRRQGLMFVDDLGDADGMAFQYPRPRTGTFWMKNTPLPLSIAFFDPEGAFMASFDMAPCFESRCPNYATPTNFLVALETPQGNLPDFGVGPGSTLELLHLPCD